MSPTSKPDYSICASAHPNGQRSNVIDRLYAAAQTPTSATNQDSHGKSESAVNDVASLDRYMQGNTDSKILQQAWKDHKGSFTTFLARLKRLLLLTQVYNRLRRRAQDGRLVAPQPRNAALNTLSRYRILSTRVADKTN